MHLKPLSDPQPDAFRCPQAHVTVELRAARIPVIGFFAHHYWFVVDRCGGRDRWEVWFRACVGGTAWGHLHRNLLPAERGVGNGPSWIEHRWNGGPAGDELAQRIETSPAEYPWRFRYRAWPGPNSNTYVQWILGDRFQLDSRAVGRRYAQQRTSR